MAITSFRGIYGFLSNFSGCQILYEGITYPSTECAYQAAKTLDMEKRVEATRLAPAESKRWGNNLDLRDDWEEVKLQVMEDILRTKFSQPEFKEKLLATGGEELVEGNFWKDVFWGQCPLGTGENHLGKLLMKIREELQNGNT